MGPVGQSIYILNLLNSISIYIYIHIGISIRYHQMPNYDCDYMMVTVTMTICMLESTVQYSTIKV